MDHDQLDPEWQSNPTRMRERLFSSKRSNAYQSSRLAQYSHLLLLIATPLLLLWFANSVANGRAEILALLAASLLLASLLCSWGYPAVRSIILIAMTANLFALVINPNHSLGDPGRIKTWIPTYLLLACLVTACFYETKTWIQSCSRSTLIKLLCWGTLTLPAALYIIAIPIFESIWNLLQGDEKKLALQDPN